MTADSDHVRKRAPSPPSFLLESMTRNEVVQILEGLKITDADRFRSIRIDAAVRDFFVSAVKPRSPPTK